ncbi:MAG: glycosyltransferase [Butyrivibrio sp.]|nr:glycosyltransferase [Butyrivibrio sp.]
MKKILFVLPNLNGGGAERVVCNLISGIDKNRYRADIFLFTKTGKYFSLLPNDTYVHYVYKENKKINKVKILLKLICVAKNYDIVMGAMELLPTYFSVLSALINKKKSVAWVHINIENILKCKTIVSRILHKYFFIPLFYNIVNTVVVVSNGSRENIRRYLKGKKKIITIYNPIQIDRIKELAKNKVEFIHNEPILISVGRLERQKNFQELIKIHKNIIDKGIKHSVIILGEGTLKQDLKNAIKEYGVDDSFKLLGFKENPYKYIASADAFVQCSLFEGLPTVLIESLALHIPVIAYDCPNGPSEILSNGKYGVLVPYLKSDCLENAIYDFLKDDRIKEKFKDRYDEAVDRFSDKKNIKKFEKLFDELVVDR